MHRKDLFCIVTINFLLRIESFIDIKYSKKFIEIRTKVDLFWACIYACSYNRLFKFQKPSRVIDFFGQNRSDLKICNLKNKYIHM
jgi:hypothetical protein